MSSTVILTAEARSDLARLDRVTRERIVATINRYAGTGHGNVRPLKGRPGEWRLRMGDWRVIFTRRTISATEEQPEERQLVVVAVRPRGGAYQD